MDFWRLFSYNIHYSIPSGSWFFLLTKKGALCLTSWRKRWRRKRKVQPNNNKLWPNVARIVADLWKQLARLTSGAGGAIWTLPSQKLIAVEQYPHKNLTTILGLVYN
jgi:hypothetical protein